MIPLAFEDSVMCKCIHASTKWPHIYMHILTFSEWPFIKLRRGKQNFNLWTLWTSGTLDPKCLFPHSRSKNLLIYFWSLVLIAKNCSLSFDSSARSGYINSGQSRVSKNNCWTLKDYKFTNNFCFMNLTLLIVILKLQGKVE